MSDYLSSVLDELVPRFAGEEGDWGRVVADAGIGTPTMTAYLWPIDTTATSTAHRGRHRRWPTPRLTRRRLVAIAVTALLAVLLATPAFGIGDRLLDLIQGWPAPSEVQTYFAANDETPEKMFAYTAEAGKRLHDRFSPVISSEARGVFAIESADGPIYLWSAPTEDGRQCTNIATGRWDSVPATDPSTRARSTRRHGGSSIDPASRSCTLASTTRPSRGSTP